MDDFSIHSDWWKVTCLELFREVTYLLIFSYGIYRCGPFCFGDASEKWVALIS